MPRITSHKLSKDGIDYEFELGFDDAALMDDAIVFDIVARRHDPQSDQRHEVPAQVKVDLTEMVATVSIEGTNIGRIRLADLNIPAEWAGDEAWSAIEGAWEGIGDHLSVDQVIQNVPVPDPIFGCILKSGISTTVGQTLRCRNEAIQTEEWRPYIRQILRCLSRNGTSMFLTALSRTFFCMATLGFQ